MSPQVASPFECHITSTPLTLNPTITLTQNKQFAVLIYSILSLSSSSPIFIKSPTSTPQNESTCNTRLHGQASTQTALFSKPMMQSWSWPSPSHLLSNCILLSPITNSSAPGYHCLVARFLFPCNHFLPINQNGRSARASTTCLSFQISKASRCISHFPALANSIALPIWLYT